MSILIKGLEMPKGCAYCPMLEGDRDDGLCHAASRWLDDEEYWLWYQYPEGDIDTSKPSNCPLIPVPSHGRLIDAGDVNDLIDAKCIEFLSKERHENCHVYEIGYRHGIEAAKAAIANSLTIIEAEGENNDKR